MADKLIITNRTALNAKYGASIADITAAINGWIAADAARGLSTILVELDDGATMTRYGANPAPPGNEAAHKAAFDSVMQAEKPSYAVLLGAPDIIPHISLKNPVFNPSSPGDDPDVNVPSDLPYACDAPYGTEPSDFVGPTRVVTRLADINGNNDSQPLIEAITHAQTARSLPRNNYSQYLGVTAAVWNQSTSTSLAAIFGSSAAMQNVPPATYQWSNGDLSTLSHYFNCHGADQDTHFYGQSGNQFPAAHDAAFIEGKLTPGVILAAECCYGAELFNPAAIGGQAPIANVYLKQGAHAVWGSTTIAYGPADTNGQADLICQYFFQEVLAGSSVGMAALRARQQFSSQANTLGPTDLKTLIQFVVLGDASVQAVANVSPFAQKTTPKVAMLLRQQLSRESRIQRRSAARQEGIIQSLFRRRTAAESVATDEATKEEIIELARRYGVNSPSLTTKLVVQPLGPKLAFGSDDEPDSHEPQRFHIVFEHLDRSARFSSRRILEIGEANGRILSVAELFTR